MVNWCGGIFLETGFDRIEIKIGTHSTYSVGFDVACCGIYIVLMSVGMLAC